MPTDYRTQIVGQPLSTDAGRDYITNVVWHGAATATPATHGDAIMTAFTNRLSNYNAFANLWVKVYDHANPLHSPPVYTAHHTGGTMGPLAPRQVALCLSFYSGLNVKGQRGRIFIGPWAASDMHEFATATQLAALLNLGEDLLHVGASDTVHHIHHPKTNTFSNVSNYFVNNRWDTMRSRLPKESARQVFP
jgi:hypothetical protein